MPKKRGRPSKAQIEAEKLLKGNSDFTLTKEMEEKAMEEFSAASSITDEDLALDRELEQMAREHQNQSFDNEPVIEVKKVKDNLSLLSTYVNDYQPASTLAQLEDQVFAAKTNECDSIEATESLVKHIFKRDFDHIKADTGYGIYKDVRVYIAGFFDQKKDADKLTMEQKLHGKK